MSEGVRSVDPGDEFEQILVIRTGEYPELCPVCGKKTTDHPRPDDLRRPVNHMLKHGWKLLHVGQQTLEVHETVAVLGEPARSTEEVPAQRDIGVARRSPLRDAPPARRTRVPAPAGHHVEPGGQPGAGS